MKRSNESSTSSTCPGAPDTAAKPSSQRCHWSWWPVSAEATANRDRLPSTRRLTTARLDFSEWLAGIRRSTQRAQAWSTQPDCLNAAAGATGGSRLPHPGKSSYVRARRGTSSGATEPADAQGAGRVLSDAGKASRSGRGEDAGPVHCPGDLVDPVDLKDRDRVRPGWTPTTIRWMRSKSRKELFHLTRTVRRLLSHQHHPCLQVHPDRRFRQWRPASP